MEDTFFKFSLGNLMEILTVLGGVIAAIYGFGRRVAGIEESATVLKEDMGEMKLDLKKLGDILTQVAVQKERLDMFDRRLDDVVHGRVRVNNNDRGRS